MSKITKEPVTHNLKIWPEYFSAVRDGLKRAELRWNDREYQAGDTLDLCEWDPNEEVFTGDFISVTVTHVAELGQWMPGYVLLSIGPPAPVAVPTFDEWLEIRGNKPLGWVKDAMRESYDACCTAVLQGAEPVTTAYKLQDGWVACSERMPDGMQTVITSNGFDIGQGWWDGEGWNSFDSHDVVPGEVTHWMPLPAAPQQEV